MEQAMNGLSGFLREDDPIPASGRWRMSCSGASAATLKKSE